MRLVIDLPDDLFGRHQISNNELVPLMVEDTMMPCGYSGIKVQIRVESPEGTIEPIVVLHLTGEFEAVVSEGTSILDLRRKVQEERKRDHDGPSDI